MAFVIALGFALVVLLAGRWDGEDLLAAFLIGLGIGAWLVRLLDARIRRLAGATPPPEANRKSEPAIYAALEDIHWRLKRLEEAQGLGPSPMEAAAEPPPAPEPDPWMNPGQALPRAETPVPAAAPGHAAPATAVDVLLQRAREWLLGGNTVVRVGIVVLFFGVGFLLKFAVDRDMVPLELRFVAVGAGAMALLAIGWRLRGRRAAYALALQGAGVGLLYLTLFSAFRQDQLLPPALALLAMVAVSGLSVLLALLQDSRALVSIGVTGGFLAPLLASTGGGNHVALFSYYAVLDLGIFAVAWFKAWRTLNLLGFFFTFGIGLLWGTNAYRPELFASTEPFLILFFGMFLAISVLFAERQRESIGGELAGLADGRLPKRIVDSALVFGLPLAAFGLQAGLTRPMEFGLAYSALALSAIYLGLAHWLRRRGIVALQLLTESFLALGVIFATLAIPLALDARWTSASWSLEGAALVWVGIHQQRRLAQAFGLALQYAAALAWWVQPGSWAVADVPVLNAFCLGAALIALAGLFSAWQLQTRVKDDHWLAGAAPAVFAWGLAWWLLAGLGEAHRLLDDASFQSVAAAYLAVTAAGCFLLERRLAWRQAGVPAAGLVLGLWAVLLATLWEGYPALGHGGWLAWPAALATQYALLARHDAAGRFAAWSPRAHALGLWLLAVLGSHALHWLARDLALAPGWQAAARVVVPGALLLAACRDSLQARWPLRAFAPSYLGWGALPLLAGFVLWVLLTDLGSAADPHPLPWLPLLNPVDLAHIFLLLATLRWARVVTPQAGRIGLSPAAPGGVWLAGGLVFVWLNAMLLRTLHHWQGVPYTPHDLYGSTLVQAAVSLFWTLLALALMATGTRRSLRGPWLAGATLMGVVVLKLFLVDLDRVGSVARIVSFVGVGLLMLLIGYLAPVPPRARDAGPDAQES